MAARNRQSAFTLLELVLVMVVMAVTLALASPSLQGWNKNARLRDAGEQFFSILRFARTQSISDARLHRLTIDTQSGIYQVTEQRGAEFAEISSSFGKKFTIPSGLVIELFDMDNHPIQSVDFYPTGRTQPGQVRIKFDQTYSPSEHALIYACVSPDEPFRPAAQN